MKLKEIIYYDYLFQRKRGLILGELDEYLFIYDLDDRDSNTKDFPKDVYNKSNYNKYSEIRRKDEVEYLNDVDPNKVDNIYFV